MKIDTSAVHQERDGRLRLLNQGDLWNRRSFRAQLLARARRAALALRGLVSWPPASRQWVIFLCYHWVLDDERNGFLRQILKLREFGDIIALDDALAALGTPTGIGGRYFCLTFDDGFRNCVANAVPVLVEAKAPAAFFVPTKYIGLDLDRDWEEIEPFYQRSWRKYGRFFEFLTWDDCRRMAQAGFTVGSHTHSHVKLKGLGADERRFELGHSKLLIERAIGTECRHFACPWGTPSDAFDPAVDPEMARAAGYASFLTTEEGPNLFGTSPLRVRRNSVAPNYRQLMFRQAVFQPSRLGSNGLRLAPRRRTKPGQQAAVGGHGENAEELK
jgi:peptidoglycan/xylan/chitin deacetylase (PgdA/CDA1 family)